MVPDSKRANSMAAVQRLMQAAALATILHLIDLLLIPLVSLSAVVSPWPFSGGEDGSVREQATPKKKSSPKL
jgi:hypothetical protein